MADERIEVEYIATQQQVLQAFEKLNRRLDTTEKKLEKTGTTSKKAAKLAEGSFAALEKELKDNEAALKRMVIGSKEFEKQRAKVDQLRRSLKGARGELAGSTTEVVRAKGNMSELASQASTWAAGWASSHAVIRAVTSELEKQKRIRLEAADNERTFEQALADLGQNVGGDNIPIARQMIQQQAPGLGVTQSGLAGLLGTAISAGAADLNDAMKLVSATLKATAGDAERAMALTGGTLDVASLGRSTNYMGALGQLLQVQSQVRSTSLPEFSANIGPGLAAATASTENMEGVSTERALETAAVISQIIKDPTGSNTATTMRQFFGRLGSFAPQEEVELDDGSVAKLTANQIETFKAANTFDERLRQMRQNPALMNQFLETQRESIGKVAVREIIAGSERAMAFEQKAQVAITPIDEAKKTFESLAANVERAAPALLGERRVAAGIEVAQTKGPGAIAGQIRKTFEDTLTSVNLPGIDFVKEKIGRAALESSEALGAEPGTAALQGLNAAVGGAVSFFRMSPTDQAIMQNGIEQIRLMQQMLNAQMEANEINRNQRPQQQQEGRPRVAPLPAATVP